MKFTFINNDIERQHLKQEMQREGEMIAMRQQVAADQRFSGGPFIASFGQISQHEWDKWRLA